MKITAFLFIILSAVCLASCTSPSDAQRVLLNAGYTNIKTGGYDWAGCGQDDFYATKFTATNPAGNRVSGTVCSGMFFKKATIRF